MISTPDYRILAGFVLISFLLMGRTSPAAGQSFGVVGGVNYTSLGEVSYEDAAATFDTNAGYHLGAYLRLGLGPIDVRPGIRYLNVGTIYEGLDEAVTQRTAGDLNDSFDVSFISVPVDAAVNLSVPLASPYAFAGPEFRFQRTPDAPEDLERQLNDWSFIGNIGFGVRVNLVGVDLALTPEFRYSFGLTNLIEKEFTYGSQTFRATEQRRPDSFFISLGIER